MPREIFPSMYKRNLREEKHIENISMQVERNRTECVWKEEVRYVALRKKLD